MDDGYMQCSAKEHRILRNCITEQCMRLSMWHRPGATMTSFLAVHRVSTDRKYLWGRMPLWMIQRMLPGVDRKMWYRGRRILTECGLLFTAPDSMYALNLRLICEEWQVIWPTDLDVTALWPYLDQWESRMNGAGFNLPEVSDAGTQQPATN